MQDNGTTNSDLGSEEYNDRAASYSKLVITLWIITLIITNSIFGKLFSWSSLVMLFPGIFVVSISSAILFYVYFIIFKQLSSSEFRTFAKSKQILLLVSLSLSNVVNFCYPIIAAIIAAILLKGF